MNAFPLPDKKLITSFIWILITSSFIQTTAKADSLLEDIKNVTHVLKPGSKEKYIHENYDFQIFCRLAEHKYIAYYFRTATLRITSSAEDIKLIKGHNPKDIYFQYKHSTKWLLWIANILPWRVRDTNFPTFNTSCVGISTNQPYHALLILRPIDPWRILTLAAGITLFFMAPKLSQSTLFFYSSGTFLGALAAALVLLFIITRFLPKGKSGYFAISVVWTLAFYYAGETWKNFEQLIHERLPYIVAYLFCGSLITFLACYRWGPPSHPRTLDIIRWALQIAGLVLIHFSSDFVELSTLIIILVLSYEKVYPHFAFFVRKFCRRLFPRKHRFLTEEEYINQGTFETQKSLQELRSYCSSPEANPWEMVNKLKNPRRFSHFIQGASHLNDDEILAYVPNDESTRRLTSANSSRLGRLSLNVQNSTQQELLTDDDDSDDTEEMVMGANNGRTGTRDLDETDDEY